MAVLIETVTANNYRSLSHAHIGLGSVNVFFGPNGAGKSSLLDAIWFVRDCCVRGVPTASQRRGQGFGVRHDRADEEALVEVGIGWSDSRYMVGLGSTAGRFDPQPAELLMAGTQVLLERQPGAQTAAMAQGMDRAAEAVPVPNPDDLAIKYSDHDVAKHALGLLRSINYLHTRSVDLGRLKVDGSPSTPDYLLTDTGANLWSALRNLLGKAAVDGSIEAINVHMRRAFPDDYKALIIEPTSPTTVYASIADTVGLRRYAMGVSDGLIQMLLVLTMLFGAEKGEPAIILLDEPDLSLHPWALAVLAEAIVEATTNWNRQVLIATHSPVLLSQFENEQVFITEKENGATKFTRLSERDDLADLLDAYALGSLYMSGAVASQGDLLFEGDGQ